MHRRTGYKQGAILAVAAALASLALVRPGGGAAAPEAADHMVQPPAPPLVHAQSVTVPGVDVSGLIRASTARQRYGVSGAGLAAAVLDTGLRITHRDFSGRIPVVHNFTTDDGGSPELVGDGNGHGTNVAGVIAAGGAVHLGVAPGAAVVPLKVLPASGNGTFSPIVDALDWVIRNHADYHISVVNLSLGDGQDYPRKPYKEDPVFARIRTLRTLGIPTCAAAGNGFARFKSRPGMAYPAITPEAVSVGAVYDEDFGISWFEGAVAHSTAPDRIAAFSQRLFAPSTQVAGTTLFAPGAPVVSAGAGSDTATSVYVGTSQATPMVTGVILLLQEYALRTTGELPPVERLVKWMRAGAVRVLDGDDEKDNVRNTGKVYRRVDALGAFRQMTAR